MKTRTLLLLVVLTSILMWIFLPAATQDKSILTIDTRSTEITALAFAPDGRTLVASSAGRSKIETWNLSDGSPVLTIPTLGTAAYLFFTRSGGIVAWNPHWTNTVKTWDSSGHPKSDLRPSESPRSGLVYCPTTQTFVVGAGSSDENNTRVVIENALSKSQRFRIEMLGRTLNSMATTPDGRILALGTLRIPTANERHYDYEVSIWDLSSGVVVSQFPIEEIPDCMTLSPNGKYLATWWLNEAMAIIVRDVEFGKVRHVLRANVKATMTDVEFSPDGRRLASGGGDRTAAMVPIVRSFDRSYGEVRIWDMTTGLNSRTLTFNLPVTRIAFSADGHRLASGYADGTIKIWSVAGE